MQNILTALIVLCTFVGMTAQELPPLATDRPDQTESSSTVGKGVVQIETGYLMAWEDLPTGNFDQDITHDFATTLLRIGILDNLELRLATSYTSFNPVFGQDISGLSPVSVGTKIDIAEESGAWPEVAFIGHITLPWIGEEEFRPNYIAPDFRFSFSHTLSDRFSLGYNLGFEWNGVVANDAFIYTIALGAAITEALSVYIEPFGAWPANGDGTHSFDAGATYLLNDNLQVDVSYGFVYSGMDSRYFSVGLSVRIP